MTDTSTNALLQALTNVAGGAASGTTAPAGYTTAEAAVNLYVPTDLLTFTAGGAMQSMALPNFVSAVMGNKDVEAQYASLLTGLGYNVYGQKGVIDPTKFQTALKQLGVAVSDADPGNPNLSTYMRNSPIGNGTSVPPNTYGSQHFYKGGAVSVPLTPSSDIRGIGDTIAQQLIGRNLTNAEVNAITQDLNKQEYLAGQAKLTEAQQQQAAYATAFGQGETSATGAPGGGGSASVGTVAKATAQQVAQLAYNAGFRGEALVTATAVALAESSGNAGALNDNPKTGDYSVGLWQVNYYGNLMQSRTQQYGAPSALQKDPAAQAAAAFSISNKGNDFSPWSTYKSGAYQQYMGEADAAVQAVTGGTNKGASTPVQLNYSGGAATGKAAGAAPATSGGGPSDTSTVSNISQLAPGQAAQVGQSVQLNMPTGQAEVLPPVAAVYNQPLTPDAETADYLKTHMSNEYQAQNMANVFQVIAQMANQPTAPAEHA